MSQMKIRPKFIKSGNCHFEAASAGQKFFLKFYIGTAASQQICGVPLDPNREIQQDRSQIIIPW